jgi:hypothetical protein
MGGPAARYVVLLLLKRVERRLTEQARRASPFILGDFGAGSGYVTRSEEEVLLDADWADESSLIRVIRPVRRQYQAGFAPPTSIWSPERLGT